MKACLYVKIFILQNPKDLWNELGKSMCFRSDFSFYGLFFYALHATGGLVSPTRKDSYIKKGVELRQRILDKLGVNGVLFYPTFPQPAMRHCESPSKMSGVMYTMFFNVMGFPSTHVPVNYSQSFFFFSLVFVAKVSSFIIIKMKIYHFIFFFSFFRWERMPTDYQLAFRWERLVFYDQT